MTTTAMMDNHNYHMHQNDVTNVPDLDDNSDADSLASALFRDDLNSLAQLIIPSSLLGVLMVDGECSSTAHDGDRMPPRELMVTFDNHETVEVKYDGLQHTIVSSHDANHPTVPNGRAVDSVTIVKDKRKKKRFLKPRETLVASDKKTTNPRLLKLPLPSFGLSRASQVKSVSRKSKWSSSASLMSYTWRSRRAPPPQSENASLTKLEDAKNHPHLFDPSMDDAELQPVRKAGRHTTKTPPTKDVGDVSSVKSGTLSSLLTFRKKQNNTTTTNKDDVRDYASLDYHPARSPVRRRRLLQGKHRNVAQNHHHPPLEEEESPLAKTVSSTSVTSSSSSPALPSIPVINHTNADHLNNNNNHSSSSMAFFLPQWPAKLDDDKEDDDDDEDDKPNNNTANTKHQTSFFSSKKEDETASWSKSMWPQDEQSPPRKPAQEPETHILRHVIMVENHDEPNQNDKSNNNNVAANVRTATAKPHHNQRFKVSMPGKHRNNNNNNTTTEKLATVESFDSFYDGLVKQKKQEPEPNALEQQYMVMQEHEFEAFQEDNNNNNNKPGDANAKETTPSSLDRNGKLPERKRPPNTSNSRFGFRPSGRFARRQPHQPVEPKAPVDSIEIPLLPKSGSTNLLTAATTWTPSMFLCAAGVPTMQHHRHTTSNSVTSSLADDESLDEEDIDPRQLLQQPRSPAAAASRHEKSTTNNNNNNDVKQNEHEEQEATDPAPGLTTRRSWFRRGLNSTRSRSLPRRGRSPSPVDTPLEKPFPIVREDYSMNDGSYHVLKIGGPH